MSQNKNHLFLFTIGPVQSFIAQARKTQDLYAGSQILSELIKEAIKKVERKDVIFPYAYPNKKDKWENIKSLPNRFIATVDLPKEKLKEFGESVEKAVRDKWFEIGQKPIMNVLCEKVNNNKSFKFDIAGINQQLEQQLEIFWLFEPLEVYQESYKNIEQNLGAIKNIRSFQQFNYNGIGERGRKCSLDGERNAYFFGEGTNSTYFGAKWSPFAIELEESNIKVAKNEGLSAVSFAKRFYNEGGFPSTAEIALLNLWNDDKITPLITDLKNLFEKGTFDQELLFDDNLNDDYIKKNGVKFKEGKTLQDAQKQQKIIFAKAKELKLKPSKYYALLAFDGDSMGEWLSKATSHSQHNNFSELLIDFAQKATKIVDKNGRTVYAGGDDFLGFVNLQGLFKTIECLKATFDTEVTKKVEIKNGTKEFTMSMGVVIAHYKMPLQKMIKLNHALLKETKKTVSDKNGIGISFLKKSGFIGKVITKNDNIELLQSVLDAIKNETFNSRMVYPFAKTFALWNDNKFDQGKLETQMALLQTEFLRLMLKNVSKEHKLSMEKLNKNMFSNLVTVENNSINLSNLIGAIRLSEGLNAEI